MSLATELSQVATHPLLSLRRLTGWITDHLERRRTIQSLGACRQSELHDVGIITQDVINLKHCRGAKSVDDLCRNAGLRSGNW